jgi:GAF domain-containing protein
LILLVLAVSIFPPLTLGVLAMRSARVAQESEVRERSAAVASWGVDKVQSYVADIEEDLRLIVELGDLQTMNPVAAKPLLSFFLSFSEDVKEISLLDASGRERLKMSGSTLVVPADLGSQAGTAKVQVPLSGETYIGQVRTSEFSEPFLTLAVPIRKLAEDRIVGVLAVEVNLKRLWDEVLSFKVGQSGYVYLVNGKGQLLAHPDFSLVLARRDLSGAGAVQRFLKGEDEPAPGTSLEYPNYQGVQVIGLHARSPKLGWGVIVEQPTAEAFAAVNRMKIETTIILINTVAVTLILAIIAARTLTHPLAELAQGARLLGAGDFDHRFPVRSRDEIAEVAERFNAMADQLQEAFQRLRTLLETSTMTSSSLELEKVLTTALEQMDHLAGRAQSGIILVEGSLATHPPASVTVRTLGMSEGARPLDLNPHDFPNLWQLLSTRKTFGVDDIATLAGSGEQALWTPQGLGAVVLLPLLSKGEILGALWMGRTSPGPFSADEVALGQTMANHVAIAIENARLHEAAQRRSAELEALLRASRSLMSGLDLQGILDRILAEAAEMAGSPHVRVTLVDREARVLRVARIKGELVSAGYEYPLEGSLSGLVVTSGEPVFSPDVQTDPRSHFGPRYQDLGIVTYLGLPIKSRGEVVGVLTFNTTDPREYTRETLAYLTSFADQAAIAIENARLYEATRRAAQEAQSLYEVGHSLTTSLDPREVLHLISVKTTELLGTPHAQVILWDDGTRSLRFGAAYGTEAEKVKVQVFRLGEGVNGVVAETRKPLLVNDYQRFPKRRPDMTDLVAVIGVPLLYRGRLLGVLTSHATQAGTIFTEDHLALLTSFANQAAVAIENARLYDALRRTSEELEFRVEARTRELREAHEELVRRERLALVGQLAGGVGHELRNPLGAIGNAVYYLRMRLGGGDDMKVQKHLAILETEVRRANKIVTDLLDFSRVKQPRRAPAQLNAIIRDILARQPRPSSVKLELDLIESLPPILVDLDQVGQVFLNLVINAIEAMPDGGSLTIRTRSTSDAVVASVSDTGIGIPPENLEKIFQPLFTTKTKGIGLGLAVSRQLIDANGGALSVESQIGKGSTFTAIFPIEESESVNHG